MPLFLRFGQLGHDVLDHAAEARGALLGGPFHFHFGLRDGAPYFGMGIAQQAAEKLAGRNDVVVEPLRNVASQGIVPPSELAAVAVAKSLVHFHQRHGFCSNCGSRSQMAQGGWKRECPNCKTETFPRTDPVVIMLVTDGGQLIRCPVNGIRIAGRSTQGVIVFDTAEDEKVVSVERLSEDEGGE